MLSEGGGVDCAPEDAKDAWRNFKLVYVPLIADESRRRCRQRQEPRAARRARDFVSNKGDMMQHAHELQHKFSNPPPLTGHRYTSADASSTSLCGPAGAER